MTMDVALPRQGQDIGSSKDLYGSYDNAPLIPTLSRGIGGAFVMSTDDMRKRTSGTSNRGLLWTGVAEAAPGKVKHLRPRPMWTPIEDLP